MAKKGKLSFEFSFPLHVLKEGKYFIAYTPALDLATSGKSFEEAKKRFREVVQLFFEELLKKETLEAVLLDLGWKKIGREWRLAAAPQKKESFKNNLSGLEECLA